MAYTDFVETCQLAVIKTSAHIEGLSSLDAFEVCLSMSGWACSSWS